MLATQRTSEDMQRLKPKITSTVNTNDHTIHFCSCHQMARQIAVDLKPSNTDTDKWEKRSKKVLWSQTIYGIRSYGEQLSRACHLRCKDHGRGKAMGPEVDTLWCKDYDRAYPERSGKSHKKKKIYISEFQTFYQIVNIKTSAPPLSNQTFGVNVMISELSPWSHQENPMVTYPT